MSVKELKSELVDGCAESQETISKDRQNNQTCWEDARTAETEKIRSVELGEFPDIDPAILARVIRGKIYTNDIILGHIFSNPGGIDINTLEVKTGFKHKYYLWTTIVFYNIAYTDHDIQ